MLAQVVEDRDDDEITGGTRPWTEAVILEFTRPTLLVRNNRFEMPESNELKQRLLPAQKRIEKHLPAVGRIEFRHHPTKRWGGTGWMISERVIATNRHVAEEFAIANKKTFTFLKNFTGQQIEACIDFREEYVEGTNTTIAGNSFEVGIESISFMETDDKKLPDIAFLKLSKSPDLPAPIPILEGKVAEQSDVVVIGYPARDSRGVESTEAARRIFGNIYDVKRLSPGRILLIDEDQWYFTHDATTLGGNSGSVILDVETGYAVGMHFLGLLHEANFAVKGQVLLDRLAKQKIQVSVLPAPPQLPPIEDVEFAEEGVPENYADREGYAQNFLGTGADFRVQLPKPVKDLAGDVLKFELDGKEEEILKYTHFSVMMSESRRMCILSAVNIEGKTSKKRKRTGWQIDPRIPKSAQIMKECYGNPPKFSRGHMTRREDPVWGTDDAASLGNSDSMHVTNAVPQMQPFNAGIWLGLEDYALDNAREDDMRITVFTGPFLRESDPEMYGVKIPVEFWKVIVFIHDKTGELCATGYTMSQEAFLQPEEFVFGGYETFQVPISSIEQKARISFGKVTELDPYQGTPEGPLSPLIDFSQIRFS